MMKQLKQPPQDGVAFTVGSLLYFYESTLIFGHKSSANYSVDRIRRKSMASLGKHCHVPFQSKCVTPGCVPYTITDSLTGGRKISRPPLLHGPVYPGSYHCLKNDILSRVELPSVPTPADLCRNYFHATSTMVGVVSTVFATGTRYSLQCTWYIICVFSAMVRIPSTIALGLGWGFRRIKGPM